MHRDYLNRYYASPPPGGASSWAELEAAASALPGFVRFTSPSLDVRVFGACSILFNVRACCAVVPAMQGCSIAQLHVVLGGQRGQCMLRLKLRALAACWSCNTRVAPGCVG